MTLILTIVAAGSLSSLSAGLGIFIGCHFGRAWARDEYQEREDLRWGEISQLNDLYEQPTYGDD